MKTTTGVVPAEGLCPRCGAKLGDYGPEGLCGACMFGGELAGEELSAEVLPSGPRHLGNYELLGEIARGGMGVVFRARQVGLNRIVALKTLVGGTNAGAEEIRRFRVEAEAAAQLKHPNIVAIHEVGEHDGQPFFSMDFIEGRTLRQLTRDNALPPREAAALLQTVAEAIQYAHERGVVHRDLKPSNVLVDAAGNPHVTDFGLAKRINVASDLTLSGVVMGTPSYMPPEQASGRNTTVGPTADVYALGAMLYDLLTGRPPFRGATPQETMAQVEGQEPVAPRLLNASTPRDLETLTLKCLEKDPSRRYASARELAQDLGRFLNHEPIQAQAPSRIYRAQKFVRRHRVAVAVAACFVAVLTTATVVSVTFGWQATQGRAAALKAQGEAEAARALASTNAYEARDANTNTQKVLKFFSQKILGAARPVDSGGLGYSASIREAMAAAEPAIGTYFARYPLAEIVVRLNMGETYIHLGDSSNAVRQLERAVEVSRRISGPRHPETLVAFDTLGIAYADQGRFEDALMVHQQVVPAYTAKYGWDDLRTMIVAYHLAKDLEHVKRFSEAIELLERVLAWARAQLPPDHEFTRDTLRLLGTTYRGNHELTRSLAMLEEFYAAEQRTASTNDLGLLVTMGALASAYQDADQPEKALPLRLENVKRREIIQGLEHPATLTARHNLATTYRALGRLNEALELHLTTLELRRKILAPDHPHTLLSMESLGRVYEEMERRPDAAKLYEEVIRLKKARLGEDHPETLSSQNRLAMVDIDMGRIDEGVALAETVVERARQGRAAALPDSIVWNQNLGRAYKAAGRFAEAIALFDDCLLRYKTNSGTRLADKLTCMHLLADATGLNGDWPRAASLFEETVKLRTSALGEHNPSTRTSVEALIKALTQAGQPDEAARWREKTK